MTSSKLRLLSLLFFVCCALAAITRLYGVFAAFLTLAGAGVALAAGRSIQKSSSPTEQHRVLLMGMLPDFVWSAFPNGDLEHLSPNVMAYTGKTLEEIKADWTSCIHPEDVTVRISTWDLMLQSGESMERDLRVRRHDGIYRWFHSRTQAVRDDKGQIIRWYTVTSDIDNQKQAEFAIRKSEQSLRLIFDSLPGMIIVNGPDGEVEFVNKTVLDFVGKQFSELISMGWVNVLHPEDAGAVVNEWFRCLETKESLSVSFRLRHFDGGYRWFKTRSQPLLDDHGNVLHWYGLLFDIDDRKKAEDLIRESELQLRNFIETLPALVWRGTPMGEIDYTNDRFLQYKGQTIIESRNCSWADLVHPDDVDEAVQRWSDSITTGVSYEDVYRLRRADGSFRWIQSRGEPFYDQKGDISHWYGLVIDIDDRKKAQEALEASEHHLRMVIETLPALVWTAMPDGEPDYINQRVVDYTGRTLENFARLRWNGILHPADIATTAQSWQSSVEAGTAYDVEHRLRHHDGNYRWFRARGEPLRDRAGRIIHWYGLEIDIDDRKRAEQALRDSERQLRLITETIPAGVTSRAADGTLEYVNKRILDFTGKSFEYLSKNAFEIIHPDDREFFMNVWKKAIANGQPYVIDHRVRHADGNYRWMQARGEPALDADGHVFRWYALAIDIDESKRLEDELLNTRARLARTSRIMTVAELSASIAHEINQPLAAVVAYGCACQRWLSADPPNLERARITADRIIRDGKAAAEVVSRIRALFKQTDPTMEPLDLNQLINEAKGLILDDAHQKRIRVETELSSQLPLATADRIQIQQVILNLMHNAIDATEVEGTDFKVLLVRSRSDRANFFVEICDQGVGLQDEELVFDPFFTTKSKGMGMGLSICRSIIEVHDGRLWARNNVHGGATFTFSLPLQSPSLSRMVPLDKSSPQTGG
jgi:PAS domain S-box-containing protein